VVTRAREILRELEQGDPRKPAAKKPAETEFEDQVSMLDMTAQNIRLALEEMNVETMTPIEAMNELYKLKRMLD
jgi:DNA mismatch repair protein MutS